MNHSFSTPSRRNVLVLAAVAALAAVGGAAAAQHAAADSSQAMSLTANPTALADHLAMFSQHLYTETGATAEQKAQLDPILRQASTDLAALHAQLQSSHGKALQALTQDNVDRDALEAARAEHVRVFDLASQRMTKLAADIADVLTPAQRKALADHIAQQHAAGHMGFHGG